MPHSRTTISTLLLAAALCVGPGCGSELEEASLAAGDVEIQLSPDSASAGVPRNVAIEGLGTDWRPGEVDVDFGAGVVTGVLIVDSSFHMTAQVIVDDDAELGARDVHVTWPGHDELLHNAFVVEPGSIALSPARATMGETIDVEVTGWGTAFQPSHTVVSFGPAVEVIDVNVLSSSRMRLVVHAPHRGTPGPTDVVVYNPGGAVYTLEGGFVIDRDVRTMTVDPDEADQGEVLVVRLFAEGASFVQGVTEVDLGTGVVTQEVDVISPEKANVQLRIGNNAVTGPRDVVVTTDPNDGPDETRILLDGFSIWPVEPDILRARASLSLGISRIFQTDSCAISTSVYASATFYEPNDFPCPPSGAFSSMAAPPHYDMASTGHSMSAGSTDCPASKTFDAGPWVRYLHEDGEVLLERYVHPYTGRINYRGIDLVLDDYALDTMHDLETPGGDMGWGELPNWYIPEVLHTLPVDYRQQGPDYCLLRHDLGEPLTVEWDPAQTYDESEMYLYMIGPSQDEGVPIMMVYPWDDGEFTYSPELLSFFTPGYTMLIQSAYRQTRFDVPGSDYVNAGIGTSNLMWRGTFEFRQDE
jgi:hypothetical protein